MNPQTKVNTAFLLIVFSYITYTAVFIINTSFLIDGVRYFCLLDDAMVSMRYARNLAEGYGLVWNPGGERIEGFTNPFWVFYMAIFHLLPIAQSKISLAIQISGAAFLLMNLYCVKEIAGIISKNSFFATLGAVFLTAFYLPLNEWSLMGMEVSLLTLTLTSAILYVIKYLKNPTTFPWFYLILCFGTVIRPDAVVPYVGIVLFLFLNDRENSTKHIFYGGSILLFSILMQTSLRFWYYNDLLPNTYYLKLTGYPLILRLTRGLFVFMLFIRNMNWLLVILGMAVLFFRRSKPVLLLVWIIAIQALYSIWVGGDAWEQDGGSNRYMAIVMPLFFILFSLSLSLCGKYLLDAFKHKTSWSEKNTSTSYGILFAFCIVLSSINLNGLNNTFGLYRLFLLVPPVAAIINKEKIKYSILINSFTSKEVKVAHVWAGTLPYFSDRFSIDILGKNDKKIANEKMRRIEKEQRYKRFFADEVLNKYTQFYPGHLKWDYGYSIGQLKPDIVVQLWLMPEQAKPFMEKDYIFKRFSNNYSVYLRRGSNNIMWNKVRLL